MTLKNKASGEISTLYDAKATIVDIHSPIIENLEVCSNLLNPASALGNFSFVFS